MSGLIPRAVVAIALLLSAPSLAAGSGADLPEGSHVERPLVPGTETVFDVPIRVQDAFVYAKLLVTAGNAVNDGTPNGTLDGEGWAVRFALVRDNGSVEELGTFIDSTPTAKHFVAEGETAVLRATVRVPDDAPRGGGSQRVYVAIASRPTLAGADPGETSGASMDASRAVTLLLSDALLPPPQPGGGEGESPPPVEGYTPPSTIVVTQQLPTWFLVGVLILGAGILVLLAAIAWLGALIARRIRPAPRSIEVRDHAASKVGEREPRPKR